MSIKFGFSIRPVEKPEDRDLRIGNFRLRNRKGEVTWQEVWGNPWFRGLLKFIAVTGVFALLGMMFLTWPFFP